MFSKKLNIQDDIAKSIDRYLSSLPDPSPNWPYDIKTAVQYIYANLFDENLTVQSIIENGRYNPSSFSGRFRFYVKHNPKQFIDNHRHILAQKLLAIPRVKVVDVAMAIGYRSHHAFTLSFRRRHSCTPSMYMDMIEEEIASDTM